MSMTSAPSSFCSFESSASDVAMPLNTTSSTSSDVARTRRTTFCRRLAWPWMTCMSTSNRAPSIPTGFVTPSWPSTKKGRRTAWMTVFSTSKLITFAFFKTSSTSSCEISRSAETTGCTPRLLKPRTWPPLTPRYTLRISTSAICSASNIAARKSSSTCSGLMISPLRTPRERACPRPMMFSAPSAFCSPTTTQIFDVPISRPAMMLESSNISPPIFQGFHRLRRHDRRDARRHPAHRHIVRHRQIRRGDGFLLLQTKIVNLLPALQLLLKVVEAESDFTALPRRRHDHARRGHIHALQIHQPGHRRFVKRRDQPQRRLHLRQLDAPARLQLKIIQARDHRQLRIHLRQRHRANARIQRRPNPAGGVQLENGNGDAAGCVGARHINLRNRVALRDTHFQRARQHALNGNRVNHRDEFEIALDRREIERDEVRARLHARPAAQLFRRNFPVRRHVNLLDRKISVFINECVERRLADAPDKIQAKKSSEHDEERNCPQPHAVRAHLIGAQFHIQHVVAVQASVFNWFASKPH